jgi:hypothetical protein
MRDGHVVKFLYLFRGAAFEPDRRAIGHGRRFVIDRLADGKTVAVVAIKQARVARWRHIAHRLACAEHAQHSVIKLFRSFDIIGTDHDVIEHASSPDFLMRWQW